MTNLTSILANESGIQYQGVNDASSSTGTYPVIGLIVGTFRGGRTDKPMTITNANIKTMLGYDPNNPHYLAVQDVLNSGVPSVQVLRVAGLGEMVCVHVESSYKYFEIRPNFEMLDREVSFQETEKALLDIVKTLTIKVDNGETINLFEIMNGEGSAYEQDLRVSYDLSSLKISLNVRLDHSAFTVCASFPMLVQFTPM